jgi:hypothetical protein
MGLLTPREIASMASTLAPVANAALIKIAQPGDLNRNGVPTGHTVTWEGEALGHLERIRHRENQAGAETAIEQDTFVVLDARGADTSEFQAGSDATATIILIEDRRTDNPVAVAFRVLMFEHEANKLLDSGRMELEEISMPPEIA